MEGAMNMFNQIIYDFKGQHILEIISAYRAVLSLILFAFIVHWLPIKWKNELQNTFVKMPVYLKVLTVIVTIFILTQFTTAGLQPFIYFQF